MRCVGCPTNGCDGCPLSLARPDMWKVACSVSLQFGHKKSQCPGRKR